jgi:cation diffusion facilitator CzcD-associated flavoprotein CzcO
VQASKLTPVRDASVLIELKGQCGLALGAELKHQGLKTLIVDKASQIGGGWRDRYESVKLHTPSYTDHWPFLKYPLDDMPTWLPRDKIIDWMEHYAKTIGLNIQLNTFIKSVKYDRSAHHYRVEIGENQILTPRHVVLATGLFDSETTHVEFPKQSDFQGQIYYSLEHKSASKTPDLANKRVAIVGTGTTSHDIAEDFHNHGAKEVTMIQRGPIFFLSRESLEEFFMMPFKMMSTEDADLMMNSFPAPVLRTLSMGMTQMMAQKDKVITDGLEKAGMAIKKGEDGIPFFDYMMGRFGRFYIDQGAAQLIIDGKIKIQRCEDGVKEFATDGVVLANGTKVDADVVILATGVPLASASSIESIMGKEFGDGIGELGTIDDNNERVGWWRPTNSPGFWYMPGNFIWSRQMSKVLALQINAIEKGMNKRYYEAYEKAAQ